MKWYIFTVIIFTVKWFILNLGREIAEIIKGMLSLVPCCYILPACLAEQFSSSHTFQSAIREAKPTPESGLYRWHGSHMPDHTITKKNLSCIIIQQSNAGFIYLAPVHYFVLNVIEQILKFIFLYL